MPLATGPLKDSWGILAGTTCLRPHREAGVGPVAYTSQARDLVRHGPLARLPEGDPALQLDSSEDSPAWRRLVG